MLKPLSPRDQPADPIHVAYAADANYGPYAGISMASVLRRFPWDWRDIHFHLLADGVNATDIERMRVTVKGKGFSQLSIYDVRNWFRRDLNFLKREPKYLTRAAYSRLFLAELLPTSINRIIYLDCDTLSLADISDLWTITKDTPVMAACPDTHINAHMPEHKQEIGMHPHAPYFNSGVVVINLAAWRQGKIGPKLVEAAKKIPHCRFYDQDPLNVLLATQTTALPSIWNAQVTATPRIPLEARMIHFSGKQKPWHLRYDGAGADLFRAVKRDSPWRFMLPETGAARLTRRVMRSIRKRVGATG